MIMLGITIGYDSSEKAGEYWLAARSIDYDFDAMWFDVKTIQDDM